MRVRRFREQNGEKPYDTCKFRTLIRRLRRHLPHLGEGFKMRRLSIDLLSFVRTLNHNLPSPSESFTAPAARAVVSTRLSLSASSPSGKCDTYCAALI